MFKLPREIIYKINEYSKVPDKNRYSPAAICLKELIYKFNLLQGPNGNNYPEVNFYYFLNPFKYINMLQNLKQ